MKRTRFFIAFILLLSIIGTGAYLSVNAIKPQAYKPFASNGDIPFNAVYNSLDHYKSYASNGEIYVAVGFGGRADVSKDLNNWEQVKRFTYENLTYVAYTGEKFVAFNDRLDYSNSSPRDHKMNIYVSENGIDWTEQWVDLPQAVTNWHGYSFMEDEFVFIDSNNSCYYMTRDFKEWSKVPFCSAITNIHSHLSIKKLNGQYILLDVVGGRPVNSRIFTLSKDNEWVEKAPISGIMEKVGDLAYFNGSYYAFSYTDERTPDFKSILRLSAYSSKDMNTWVKSNIAVMHEDSSEITSLHSYTVNGKIHLFYSVDNHFADTFSDRTRTVEMTSTDGILWQRLAKAVPVRSEYYDVDFSVLNGRIILVLESGNTLISKGNNDWSTLEMPKYGTGHKAVFVGDEYTVLQDSVPYETAPGTYAMKAITTVTRDGINMTAVESASISQWTGRKFVAEGKTTTDFKNWKDIKIPEELSRFRDTIYYTWADGLYIAQVYVYYSDDREFPGDSEALREKGYDKTVYVFDSDFNLLDKHKFDSEVEAVKFINGMYFVSLRDGRIFRSIDTKEWTESSNAEMLGQPIHNGRGNYMRNDVTGDKVSGISVSSDKQNWKSVSVNGEILKNCSLAGDYYLAQGSDNIYISKDGIYWVKISIPYEYWGRSRIHISSDYLLVNSFNWLFYYPMEAIKAAFEHPDSVYRIQ